MLDEEPDANEGSCHSDYGLGEFGDAPPLNRQGVPFGSFVDDDSPYHDKWLRADIYRAGSPDPGDGDVKAVMIMIYGGGWQKGCRQNVIQMANLFAPLGYTVLAIDYRMTCDENESNPPGYVNYRCDFTAYSDPDDPIYADVLKAIAYARGATVNGNTINDADSRIPDGSEGL